MVRHVAVIATTSALLASVLIAGTTAGRTGTHPHHVAAQPAAYSQQLGRLAQRTAQHRTTAAIRARERQLQSSAAAPRASLTGRVTDQAGHPLRDVVVSELYGLLSTRTAADGRFTLRVPVGHNVLTIDGSRGRTGPRLGTGYLSVQRSTVVRGSSGTLPTVALTPGGVITGRFTDDVGHPLVDAEVAAFEMSTLPGYVPADAYGIAYGFTASTSGQPVTNAQGRYRLTGVSPQSTVVCFDDIQSGAPTGGDGTRTGYAATCSARPVAPASGATVDIGSLALRPLRGGFVHGRVLLPDGRPARGLDVLVFDNSQSAQVDTDRDGRFVSPGLATGRWHVCPFVTRFDVAHAPNAYVDCRVVTVPVGRSVAASFRLQRGGSVSGRVTLHDRPVRGVAIEVTSAKHGGFATSRGSGRFEVTGLQPGSYRVCVRTQAAGPTDPTGILASCTLTGKIHIGSGASVRGVRLATQPAAAVTGRVTAPGGSPLAHATGIDVEARQADAQTNAAGEFRIVGVTPGRGAVCVEVFATDFTHGSCRHDVRLRGGSTTHVALTAVPARQLVVHLRDSAGHPLSAADVVVLSSCPSQQAQFGECPPEPAFSRTRDVTVIDSEQTSAAGRAVLHVPHAGHYAVCAFDYYAAGTADDAPTGYADSCDAGFDVTAAAPTTTLTRTAAQAGAFTGRIVTAAGKPVAGAHLAISGSAAADYITTDGLTISGLFVPQTPKQLAVTDSRGYYTVYSVTPGSQTVCGTGPRGSKLARSCLGSPVTVTAGSTTTAPTLTMRAG